MPRAKKPTEAVPETQRITRAETLHMEIDALSACADVLSEVPTYAGRKRVIACLLQLFVVSQGITTTAEVHDA